MWTWALSQSTSSPFIQIFGVGVIGMGSVSHRAGSFTRSKTRSVHTPGDLVTDGRGAPGDRLGAGFADALGGVGLAEEVEHEGGRQDRGARIGDVGAGDVGRRAVDGLEHRWARASRVEVGRRR